MFVLIKLEMVRKEAYFDAKFGLHDKTRKGITNWWECGAVQLYIQTC